VPVLYILSGHSKAHKTRPLGFAPVDSLAGHTLHLNWLTGRPLSFPSVRPYSHRNTRSRYMLGLRGRF